MFDNANYIDDTEKQQLALCDVSIILPIHNGGSWINNCFQSILHQTALKIIKIELCICDDGSSDNTNELLNTWKSVLEKNGMCVKIYENKSSVPGGVGFAKNKAIELSVGSYLCFQDVDDVMHPDRILYQYKAALELAQNTLIGSRFNRNPENSTVRYTKWANELKYEQLTTQIYTSHGPTLIMPTWFFHRSVFDRIGGFSESGRGTPEDLIFFYKHLDNDGKLFRVDASLLTYYYHQCATTFSITEKVIWDIRLERLQTVVLSKWFHFTIWNAGKQGRRFYNALSIENQKKVTAMADVDIHKIGKFYAPFDNINRKFGKSIKVIHFKAAKPPFIICVKMDLTNGNFEENLETLHLQEGVDYIYFS